MDYATGKVFEEQLTQINMKLDYLMEKLAPLPKEQVKRG